ncbi:hypothetical protein [Massilia sp. ST3]|uniref:hypothetical protein n=1 Tax=Massilia sp. ST3 TaxID=2824903 RepID=UPI001B815F28|nr:hypothetical protein [Massilia sp. ST3]MBQ5949754.1 hypothetical protein [Massilia sp. ST3]
MTTMSLLRLRARFFASETKGLYQRYADACLPLFLLCAPALPEVAALAARPVLALGGPPGAWRDPAPLLAWCALALVWARIHRGFVDGGPLAGFTRSLPLSGFQQRLVDLALLVLAMSVFALPFAFGLWTAVHEAAPGARFWLGAAVLALLTLSLARDAVYGARPGSLLLHLLALGALLAGSLLDSVPDSALLCTLSACLAANLARTRGAARRKGAAHLAWLEILAWSPALVLLLTTTRRLLHLQWHDSLSRILWACLPLGFSWWLLEVVGKREDTHLFVHAALGAFIGILAGCYRVLLDSRAALSAYARSMAHGEHILAGYDHALVLSIAAALLLPWLAALGPAAGPRAALLCFYTGLLALLGNRRIQLHPRSALLTFGLATAGTLIAGNLL